MYFSILPMGEGSTKASFHWYGKRVFIGVESKTGDLFYRIMLQILWANKLVLSYMLAETLHNITSSKNGNLIIHEPRHCAEHCH